VEYIDSCHGYTIATFTLTVDLRKLSYTVIARGPFVNANMSWDWSWNGDILPLLGLLPECALCEQKAGPMP